MLRSEHSIVRYDFRRQQVHPDRLRRGRDDDYLPAAKILLRFYRDGFGRTRQSLHRDVEQILSRLPSCPPRRIAAFCKLLDDQSSYRNDKKQTVELRRKVFSLAAPLHPIVQQPEGIFEHTIDQARKRISDAIGLSWTEIDAQLFGDVIELQTLQSFNELIGPDELLSLYNVSQTQASLYRATRMRIEAYNDFKTILSHAKLAGLMHRIERIDGARPGYRFELDGPQSSLRETSRYGIRFATLLPKLLACRQWRMVAELIGPQRQQFRLTLSPQDGLRSTLDPPAEFDSELERETLDIWKKTPVDGWTMEREGELLHQGQTVLTPDFVLKHPSSGRKIYLEVVGFWTPEYLQEKLRRLKQFTRSNDNSSWLLMFSKANASAGLAVFADLPACCIVLDKRSKPAEWIAAALVDREA